MRISSFAAARSNLLFGIALALPISISIPIAGLAAERPLALPDAHSTALPSRAAEGSLTLFEAQRLAVERSQQLTAQDASVRSSREMAVAAGQLPDPTLRLGIQDLPIEGSDSFSLTRDSFTMRQIGVTQEFTGTKKRELRAQRFEREADRSLAQKHAEIATIRRDTAIAWLERYYAEEAAKLFAEQVAESRLEIEAAESAYRGGRGSQAEVFAARSALVLLEDQLSMVGRRIRVAQTMLARWVGDDASKVPLDGKPDLENVRHIGLDRGLLGTQLLHHPDITVQDKQLEIARTEAELARANRKADWSVELMYSKRGSRFSDFVSVGIAIPLQWDQKNRQDRELAAKLALTAQIEAQRDEALRAHVAEVGAQIETWRNGLERHARYSRELLPLANERARATVAAYRGGKASLGADVLPARRNEIEVRLQALQIEMDTARIWAQLNFLFPDGANGAHTRGFGH